MIECETCGLDLQEMNPREQDQHRHWCEGVERIVGRATGGAPIRPDHGTHHQIAEAFTRFRDRMMEPSRSDSVSEGGDDADV